MIKKYLKRWYLAALVLVILIPSLFRYILPESVTLERSYYMFGY